MSRIDNTIRSEIFNPQVVHIPKLRVPEKQVKTLCGLRMKRGLTAPSDADSCLRCESIFETDYEMCFDGAGVHQLKLEIKLKCPCLANCPPFKLTSRYGPNDIKFISAIYQYIVRFDYATHSDYLRGKIGGMLATGGVYEIDSDGQKIRDQVTIENIGQIFEEVDQYITRHNLLYAAKEVYYQYD